MIDDLFKIKVQMAEEALRGMGLKTSEAKAVIYTALMDGDWQAGQMVKGYKK